MRQIKAISLIALVSLPILTSYCYLHWKQGYVRHEIKERLIRGIDKDDLEVLTFAVSDAAAHLKWEHDREFEYLGEMYDVVETTFHGDSVTYHCLWDHEESRIKRQLRQLTLRALSNDPETHDNQATLVHFFKSLHGPDLFTRGLTACEDNPRDSMHDPMMPGTRLIAPPSPPPRHS